MTTVGIPYVSVSPGEADALRERLADGPVTIDVRGRPHSPYAYAMHPIERGRVPASLTYELTERRLAAIDARYHAETPTGYATESWAVTKSGVGSPAARLPQMPAPGRRIEYVGPVDPEAAVVRQTSSEQQDLIRTLHVFGKRDRLTQHWNAGPLTPGAYPIPEDVSRVLDPGGSGQGVSFCSICRQGDSLWPFYVRIGAQGQLAQPGTDGLRLYRNGTEIPLGVTGVLPAFELPEEAGDYRLTLDDPRNRTTAEWTFRSETVTDAGPPGYDCLGVLAGVTDPCRPEQVVFVSYDMSRDLGLDNSVPAGRRHTFDVHVYHSPSTARLPAVAGLRVWTSTDDGETWTPAHVRRGRSGDYTVSAKYPRLRDTRGAVSLRAEAWDAAGNRVTQTTLRAFTLR